MSIYYHLTEQRFLADILRVGLKPAVETGNTDPTSNGIISDPNYIYLWKREHFPRVGVSMRSGMCIIRASLPEGFLLERDYSQFTFLTKLDNESLKLFFPDFTNKHDYITRKFAKFGVRLLGDLSDENVRMHVDKVTPEKWDEQSSAYQTRLNIPPDLLEHLV